MNKLRMLLLSVAMLAVPSFAEEGAVEAEAEAFEPSLSAYFEVRPTYASRAGTWGTENTADLSFQVAENVTLGYRQYFETNIWSGAGGNDGLNLRTHDGFFRAKFSNLWTSEDGNTSLSYEPRAYLPTRASVREAGLAVINRNYITLKSKVSENVTLSFVELPILHLYDRPGVGDAANPFFENRLYFLADFKLAKGISLNLNLFFHQARRRDYGLSDANDWSFVLWTYPEITFAVSDTVSLGLAYYSGNLINGDLSGFDIANGLENGAYQVVLGASI